MVICAPQLLVSSSYKEGQDSNLQSSGHDPDELTNSSTPLLPLLFLTPKTKDLGYKQAILEIDFEYCLHVVIHLISSKHPQAQLIQAWINLVQRDWQCFCKHTQREEIRKSWTRLSTSHPIRVKPRKRGKSFAKAITNNRIMFKMSTSNLNESRIKASTLSKKDGMATYELRISKPSKGKRFYSNCIHQLDESENRKEAGRKNEGSNDHRPPSCDYVEELFPPFDFSSERVQAIGKYPIFIATYLIYPEAAFLKVAFLKVEDETLTCLSR
ncbi:hypothetical protein HAX54_007112 [Datura stramonium]|uniref:Uncharacterized protein n=1 Tax=Datura stramonium TaxID=4076 RepID=A0ABS8WYI6_DATST|nr:hypothetical protein [Datura stramonium]